MQWHQVVSILCQVDRGVRCPIVVTHKLRVDQPRIYRKLVLTLPFERSSLQSLDKILQVGPRYSLLGTATPCVYLLCDITVHVTRSLRPSPSVVFFLHTVKRSKTTVGRPGSKATRLTFKKYYLCSINLIFSRFSKTANCGIFHDSNLMYGKGPSIYGSNASPNRSTIFYPEYFR